ncbi:hypothetical protein HU765_15360 [Pseudomonas sp. SWRI81]|uniref:hypothetical protein n=1 Tax=Pseudomonas sp. SWRI81 TaxID=2745505 RepID=UPI0016493338|nr:hypothetical protein [Pseudomonas sp. SWRI81]MBC3271321.1 hypothetical protein [Pseudomonas sp. SWRI81]
MLWYSSMTGEDMEMKKMTAEKNDLPVPVIIEPVEGAKVGRSLTISGAAKPALKGDILQVFDVAGGLLFQVGIITTGQWSGVVRNLAPGAHGVVAKLVRAGQPSIDSAVRNFIVE